jgi:hypothetical protein
MIPPLKYLAVDKNQEFIYISNKITRKTIMAKSPGGWVRKKPLGRIT